MVLLTTESSAKFVPHVHMYDNVWSVKIITITENAKCLSVFIDNFINNF